MILIDFNQVVISGFTSFVSANKIKNPDEDLIRHVVINTLRTTINQFKHQYGEVVICCDNKKYWRKEVYPHYKAMRKKNREKSDLDWNKIFKILNELREDLKIHFPYKVIDVDGAEADDVIAILTMNKDPDEKIIICSSDGDFKQLQRYDNVKQYNPMNGTYIKSPDVLKELKEKIIRGDSGDGLSNILSQDDCFIVGKRQNAISSKKIELWIDKNPEEFCTEDMLARYNRNKLLIDFEEIPNSIKDSIINAYKNCIVGNKTNLYKYFIDKNLVNLMDVIDEF